MTGIFTDEELRAREQDWQRKRDAVRQLEYIPVDVSEIRCFKLNDCDWVASRNLDEAIEWYCAETDLPRDEAIEDPKESSLTLQCYRDEVREGKPNTTVGELVREHFTKGYRFPVVIISTEY